MSTEQLGLFGPPEPVAVAVPRKVVGVRWTAYHAKTHTPCMHCVLATHEKRGQGPVDIRPASARRTSEDGDLLLCRSHTEIKKASDIKAGLVKKPGRAA